jgi:hypothetical protein
MPDRYRDRRERRNRSEARSPLVRRAPARVETREPRPCETANASAVDKSTTEASREISRVARRTPAAIRRSASSRPLSAPNPSAAVRAPCDLRTDEHHDARERAQDVLARTVTAERLIRPRHLLLQCHPRQLRDLGPSLRCLHFQWLALRRRLPRPRCFRIREYSSPQKRRRRLLPRSLRRCLRCCRPPR